MPTSTTSGGSTSSSNASSSSGSVSGNGGSSSQASGANTSGGNSSGSNSSGDSTTGSGGSSGSSSGGSEAEEHFRQDIAAHCAYEERCAAQVGRNYSTLAACTAAYESVLPQLVAALSGVTFNVANRQACLDARWGTNVSCIDRPNASETCSSYFVLENPLAAGASCGDPTDTCDLALSCVHEAWGCARCMALAAVGQACSNALPCAGHAGCVNGICTLPAGRGEPCGGVPCAGGLMCSGAAGMPATCMDRVALGQNCDTASCYRDLSCEPGTTSSVCVALPAEGATCGRSAATECMGAYCRFETPSAPTGECTRTLFSTTIGDPCLMIGAFPLCDTGRPQIEGTPGEPPTACTCVDYTPAGQPCFDVWECELECVGLNPSTTPPTPGTCSAPAADGANCGFDRDCISGFCSRNGLCGTAPVCE